MANARKATRQGDETSGTPLQPVGVRLFRALTLKIEAVVFAPRKKTAAVQYVANSGQLYRGLSGRVFALNVEGGRVELVEVGSGNRFILVEYYGCAPSAELVNHIGSLAVGESIRSVARGHVDPPGDALGTPEKMRRSDEQNDELFI